MISETRGFGFSFCSVIFLQSLDISRIDRIIRCSLRSQGFDSYNNWIELLHGDDFVCAVCFVDWWLVDFSGLPAAAIEPVPESSVSKLEERSQEERERWWKKGLKAISDGKLAVLLLSGGQVSFKLFWRKMNT